MSTETPIAERRDTQHGRQSARTRRARAYLLLEPSTSEQGASSVVDRCLIALILLNVIAVLIESVEPAGRTYASYFRLFELFSVAVFSIEYLGRVWTAVEAPEHAALKTPWRVRLAYMCSIPALIDLVAVLPFYLSAFGLLGGADMRMLRVLRLLRLFKLSRYASSVHLLLQVLKENARNLAAAVGIMLIILILAASGIYLIERDVQPEAFGSIPAAMWWAFATLTTVGYGDVTPVTPLGKAFGAVITLLSLGIVALPAGLLASSFSERLRQRSMRYRHLADLAAADGIITAEESAMLDRERRALGLGEDLAATIVLDGRTRVRDAACPHCGAPLGE